MEMNLIWRLVVGSRLTPSRVEDYMFGEQLFESKFCQLLNKDLVRGKRNELFTSELSFEFFFS